LKIHTAVSKISHKATGDLSQNVSGSENALAITPPNYGIEFVDSGMAANAPVQCLSQNGETQKQQSPSAPTQIQPEPKSPRNNTGLPDGLKSGIESLSGISMDNVKVHYNSSRPTRLNALAYAQGSDIHVAPGQEKHLPHEAWHVVQQAQGRVKPTIQAKGEQINDELELENEADVMGQRALDWVSSTASDKNNTGLSTEHTISRQVKPVMQRIVDSVETEADDDGHGAGVDAAESLIDWSQLTQQAAERLTDNTLFNIFCNLVAYHYQRAGKAVPNVEHLVEPYKAWKSGGVFTRAKFKTLINLQTTEYDNVNDIIQMARTGHTWSRNGDYTGTSNAFKYDEVIYWRDEDGNIDFDTNPANEVFSFNGTEVPVVKTADMTWQDPVEHASRISMNNDLTDKKLGIMPSGKSVPLATASRSQHFAIADMLYPNDRTGTWTWHHLKKKYEMVLVDMKVHAKHGHNGGVHIWNK
jgi:hypothetical protein